MNNLKTIGIMIVVLILLFTIFITIEHYSTTRYPEYKGQKYQCSKDKYYNISIYTDHKIFCRADIKVINNE